MDLAVNYSRAAADLFDQGHIAVDCFKCPAWPDLVSTLSRERRIYVHFPLRAGPGGGDVVDTETSQGANWALVESLLFQTNTRYVNVHLAPTARDHPTIPSDSTSPVHVEQRTDCLIRDVGAVVERFGPERVIVENDHSNGGLHLRAAHLPAVIRQVVAETGCGLLLDVSHARLAAVSLGMDVWMYLNALPLSAIREIHLTGIQRFDVLWAERLRARGIAESVVQRFAGHLMDHLPLTTEDWDFTARALECVRHGAWGQPWVLALEYGGVGPLWEAITDSAVLIEQVPRLRNVATA